VDGGNAFPGLFRSFPEGGDFLDRPRCHGDEVGAGDLVLDVCGIASEGAERGWIDHERARDRPEQPFDTAALLSRPHYFDQAFGFQLAQVVVEFLARQPEASRQSRRGVRLSKLL